MALTLLPDMEDVCGDYLREQTDIVAIGAKVVGSSLGSSRTPWVRVVVIDEPRVGPTDHLVEHYLQFDCFAGTDATAAHSGQAEVNLLARTVRAALNELPATALTGLVVSAVNVSRGPRMVDDTVEPAREHVPVTASIWAHSQ